MKTGYRQSGIFTAPDFLIHQKLKGVEVILLLTLITAVGAFIPVSGLTLISGILIIVAAVTALVIILNPFWGVILFAIAMSSSPRLQIGQLEVRSIELRVDDLLFVLILVGWAGNTLMHSRARQMQRILPRHILVPIWLFWSIGVVSSCVGAIAGYVDPLAATFYILKLLQYVLLFIAIFHLVDSRRKFVLILGVLVAVGVFVNLWAWLQMATSLYFTNYVAIPDLLNTQAYFSGRATLPFDRGPNMLGNYFVIYIPILVCIGIHFRDRLTYRVTISALLVLSAFSLVFSGSRSGFLGVGAALLVLATTARPYHGSLVRRVLALCIVFYVVFQILIFIPTSRELWFVVRLKEMFSSDIFQASSVTTRTNVMWQQESLPYFWKNPLLGVGLSFRRVFDSNYVRILVEMGVLGFTVYMWQQYALWRHVHKIYASTQDPLLRLVAAAGGAALIGLLFSGTAAEVFAVVRTAEPFWFLMAVICGYAASPDALAPPMKLLISKGY